MFLPFFSFWKQPLFPGLWPLPHITPTSSPVNTSPTTHSDSPTPSCMDPCDYIGPTQIIRIIFHFKLIHLITLIKFFLPCKLTHSWVWGLEQIHGSGGGHYLAYYTQPSPDPKILHEGTVYTLSSLPHYMPGFPTCLPKGLDTFVCPRPLMGPASCQSLTRCVPMEL